MLIIKEGTIRASVFFAFPIEGTALALGSPIFGKDAGLGFFAKQAWEDNPRKEVRP